MNRPIADQFQVVPTRDLDFFDDPGFTTLGFRRHWLREDWEARVARRIGLAEMDDRLRAVAEGAGYMPAGTAEVKSTTKVQRHGEPGEDAWDSIVVYVEMPVRKA